MGLQWKGQQGFIGWVEHELKQECLKFSREMRALTLNNLKFEGSFLFLREKGDFNNKSEFLKVRFCLQPTLGAELTLPHPLSSPAVSCFSSVAHLMQARDA
jgi:hypothetical protein